MKKILLLFVPLLILSSCCWFRYDDCATQNEGFLIPVEINYTDTLIQVGDLLPISIKSSQFASIYNNNNYSDCNFSMNVRWFNGDFVSDANHKIQIFNSQPYFSSNDNGYSGNLPTNNINFDVSFTTPGYYMLEFYGSANGYNEKKRCGCDYLYTYFSFESNIQNVQYFDIYQASTPYFDTYLNHQQNGVYFIKVE